MKRELLRVEIDLGSSNFLRLIYGSNKGYVDFDSGYFRFIDFQIWLGHNSAQFFHIVIKHVVSFLLPTRKQLTYFIINQLSFRHGMISFTMVVNLTKFIIEYQLPTLSSLVSLNQEWNINSGDHYTNYLLKFQCFFLFFYTVYSTRNDTTQSDMNTKLSWAALFRKKHDITIKHVELN